MSEPTKHLYRSRSQRMIAGVCGGLGTYFNIDATMFRVIFIIAAFFGFPAVVLIYLVMMVIVPEEPATRIETPPASQENQTTSQDTNQ